MAANYLERIVVAGSRKAALAEPAVSGPPLMPAWMYPLPVPPADSEVSSFDEIERRGVAASSARDGRAGPAVNRATAPEHQTTAPTEPKMQEPDPSIVPRAVDTPHSTRFPPSRIDTALLQSSQGAEPRPIVRMPSTLRRSLVAPGTMGIVPAVPLSSADSIEPLGPASAPVATASVMWEQPTAAVPLGTETDLPVEPHKVAGFGPSVSVPPRIATTAMMDESSAERPFATMSVRQNQSSSQTAGVQDTVPDGLSPLISAAQPSNLRPGVVNSEPRAEHPTTSSEPVAQAATALVPRSAAVVPSNSVDRPRPEPCITIGRVEVQVNNLSPRAPTVTAPAPAPSLRLAGSLLPGSYYLDRFSLRP
jgi:hypothetical protein